MNNSKLSIAIKTGLMFAALDSAAVSAADGDDSPEIETVVVTGSRIARNPDFMSPVPMTTVGGAELGEAGFNVLGDVLMNMPQALVNSSLQGTGTLFNAGQSRVDLRGLGSNRTLVLLDGRRFITGDFRAPSADLNMIPGTMIDRVEIISGGASAVYGSEAIAGVVNIITRTKYDGFTFDIQSGISDRGDGEEINVSLDYGLAFADDRARFAVGAEYTDVEEINQVDRSWAYPGIRRNNTVSPQTVIPASRSNIMPTATFQLVNSNVAGTARSVSIAQDRSALYVNSQRCRTATVSALCQDPWLFYIPTYNLLQAPMDRRTIRAQFDFDLSNTLGFFMEGLYSGVEARSVSSPVFSNASGTGTMPVSIRGDNAFLNGSTPLATQLRNEWTGAGLTLVRATTVNVGKFWEEFGSRETDVRREVARAVFGFKGQFESWGYDFDWDAYLMHGELKGRVLAGNVPNIARVRNAVDATLQGGEIVCNDAAARAAGCVPWDLINGPSAAAVQWANAQARFTGRAIQEVAAANLTAELFELPGGPLGVAAGLEHRTEFSDFIQDELSASNALFYNSIGRTVGEYSMREAYVELAAPLLSRRSGTHLLSVEAAGRIADYSNAGGVDQWRLQSTWAPVRQFSLRASVATAVRAPNITEAYGPRSQSFTTAALDPCDFAQMANVTDPARRAVRIANCAAVIPTYDPLTHVSNIGPGRPSLRTVSGSNPNLFEETAETMSFGMMLAPGEQDRFQISVDFWRIHVDDAISTVPINTLISTLCYDSAQAVAGNRFCQAISRDADGNVIEVSLANQNVQSIKTEGIDIAMQFSQPLGAAGDLDLRINSTTVTRWELTGFPGGATTKFAGTLARGIPDFKARGTLGWKRGAWSAEWESRFLDSYAISETEPASSYDPFYTGTYLEHDLRATFDLSENMSVRVGVINITDEHPPLVPEVGNATDSTSTATFDNRGRFFYAGFKYSFGSDR